MEYFSIEAIVNSSIFYYALILISTCIMFVLISALEVNRYISRNSYVTNKELLVSPHAPSISIIAPVLNAEETIINQVRALFALQYNNFEIILVNDGSTDGTFQKLFDYYQLETVDFAVNEQIKTKEVFAYYKSRIAAFSRLMVIDKAPGGKADSLNAGINSSERDLVLCLEMNCFLHKNSLLKLVKPFLEEKTKVIAVGTVVQIANSCEKINGHLIKANFPRRLWPGFQALEYFKRFLIERLTWSRMNGVHEVSGAVNLFNREMLINSGAYSSRTSKEGFELMIRMCRYMHDHEIDYRTVYIPDSLCWIESPCNFKKLGWQKRSWAAGNYQTFKLNKDLFFNRKYGFLGLVNFPYWFFYESITPLFKVLSIIMIVALSIKGTLNWEYTAIILLMIYFFTVMVSLISLVFKEKSYKSSPYNEVARMVILSFLSPLIYQPLNTYWKVSAYFSGRSVH